MSYGWEFRRQADQAAIDARKCCSDARREMLLVTLLWTSGTLALYYAKQVRSHRKTVVKELFMSSSIE